MSQSNEDDLLWQNNKCLVCQSMHITSEAWETHKLLASHVQKAKVQRFLDSNSRFEAVEQKSAAASLLQSAKLPHLGKECIHEFHHEVVGFSFWICSLCYCACAKLDEMSRHLLSNSHRMTYVCSFYPEKKPKATSSKQLTTDLDDVAVQLREEQADSLPEVLFLCMEVAEAKELLGIGQICEAESKIAKSDDSNPVEVKQQSIKQPDEDEEQYSTGNSRKRRKRAPKKKKEPEVIVINDDVAPIEKAFAQFLSTTPVVNRPVIYANSNRPGGVVVSKKTEKRLTRREVIKQIDLTDGASSLDSSWSKPKSEEVPLWCKTCWQVVIYPNNGPKFQQFWLMHTVTDYHQEKKARRESMVFGEENFVEHMEPTASLDLQPELDRKAVHGWVWKESTKCWQYSRYVVGLNYMIERYEDNDDCMSQKKDMVCLICMQSFPTKKASVQGHALTEEHVFQFAHKKDPDFALRLLNEVSFTRRRGMIDDWLRKEKFKAGKMRVYNESLMKLHMSSLGTINILDKDVGKKRLNATIKDNFSLYKKRNDILKIILNSGFHTIINDGSVEDILIQKQIDQCTEPLIGLQYVAELYHGPAFRSYVCRLCGWIMPDKDTASSAGILSHLRYPYHQLCYLKKRFKSYAEQVESFRKLKNILPKAMSKGSMIGIKIEEYAFMVEQAEGRKPIDKRLNFQVNLSTQLLQCFPKLAAERELWEVYDEKKKSTTATEKEQKITKTKGKTKKKSVDTRKPPLPVPQPLIPVLRAQAPEVIQPVSQPPFLDYGHPHGMGQQAFAVPSHFAFPPPNIGPRALFPRGRPPEHPIVPSPFYAAGIRHHAPVFPPQTTTGSTDYLEAASVPEPVSNAGISQLTSYIVAGPPPSVPEVTRPKDLSSEFEKALREIQRRSGLKLPPELIEQLKQVTDRLTENEWIALQSGNIEPLLSAYSRSLQPVEKQPDDVRVQDMEVDEETKSREILAQQKVVQPETKDQSLGLWNKLLNELLQSETEPFNYGETALIQKKLNECTTLLLGINWVYEVCSSDFPVCQWRSYVCAICPTWETASAIVEHLQSDRHREAFQSKGINILMGNNQIQYRLKMRVYSGHLEKLWPGYKRVARAPRDQRTESALLSTLSVLTPDLRDSRAPQMSQLDTNSQAKVPGEEKRFSEPKQSNSDHFVGDKPSEELKRLKKDAINALMNSSEVIIPANELPVGIQKQLDQSQQPLVGIDDVFEVCDTDYPKSDWRSYLCYLCAAWIDKDKLIEHLTNDNHRIVYMATNGIRIWDQESESFSNASTLIQKPEMLAEAAAQIESRDGRSHIRKRCDYHLPVSTLRLIWPGLKSIDDVKQSSLQKVQQSRLSALGRGSSRKSQERDRSHGSRHSRSSGHSRHHSPTPHRRKGSPSRRKGSPTRRKDSPTRRKVSPPRRKPSPLRKNTSARRNSPTSHKRSHSKDKNSSQSVPFAKKSRDSIGTEASGEISKQAPTNTWDAKAIDFLQNIGVVSKQSNVQMPSQVPPLSRNTAESLRAPPISSKPKEIPASASDSAQVLRELEASQKKQSPSKVGIKFEIRSKERQIEEMRQNLQQRSEHDLAVKGYGGHQTVSTEQEQSSHTHVPPAIQQQIEQLAAKVSTPPSQSDQQELTSTNNSGQLLRAFLGVNEEMPTEQLLVKMFIEERERQKKQEDQYQMMTTLLSQTLSVKNKQSQDYSQAAQYMPSHPQANLPPISAPSNISPENELVRDAALNILAGEKQKQKSETPKFADILEMVRQQTQATSGIPSSQRHIAQSTEEMQKQISQNQKLADILSIIREQQAGSQSSSFPSQIRVQVPGNVERKQPNLASMTPQQIAALQWEKRNVK